MEAWLFQGVGPASAGEGFRRLRTSWGWPSHQGRRRVPEEALHVKLKRHPAQLGTIREGLPSGWGWGQLRGLLQANHQHRTPGPSHRCNSRVAGPPSPPGRSHESRHLERPIPPSSTRPRSFPVVGKFPALCIQGRSQERREGSEVITIPKSPRCYPVH